MKFYYAISDVRPYINWLYFYHAWSMTGKPGTERERLRRDAERLLDTWQDRFHTHAHFVLLPANGDGDDLLLGGERIPMLRQQQPSTPGGPYLCLTDFVRPLASGVADKAGVFAATVDASMEHLYPDDPYMRMLAQTLCDRLAEASVEVMHRDVRMHYWGYAPHEQLTVRELQGGRYQGIRPAAGYPCLPDMSINFLIDRLLPFRDIGIQLLDSGMMQPHASVSGFLLAHPRAHYFDLGKIGEDQLRDYARRRHLPVKLLRRYLGGRVVPENHQATE